MILKSKFAIQDTFFKGDIVYINQQDCNNYIANFNEERIKEETKYIFLGYKPCANDMNIDCIGCRGFFYLENIETGVKGTSCLMFTDRGIILQKVIIEKEFFKNDEFMI